MKKFLNIFFVTLGVIFFIIILVAAYFYITDPLNLKPLIFGDETETVGASSSAETSNPTLSESQEKALDKFGIDPNDVPSEFTPEQEACFEAELGEDRVAEIKAGDSPTAIEYLKARDCI
ncbi:hypothetical protein GW764_02245 [Candidatus Parcubacteria bacterium]|nr:hypothetical protein [Candidatus Parcubacteria bacterium]